MNKGMRLLSNTLGHMKINPSLKARPTSSFFQTIFSLPSIHRNLWLALSVLSFVYSSSAFADVWLNQDYSTYTVGDQVSTNNTPSLLTSVPSNNVIVNVNNNLKLQYNKQAPSAGGNGGGTLYKLSDNLSTDRPQGYFSFKAAVNTNVTGTSYLSYVLGANDSNSMNTAASTYLQIRLYNSNSTPGLLRIYSGSGTTNNPTQVWPTNGSSSSYSTLPTGENSFQVWYNKTASGMTYTNPAGVSNQVSPNAFVVYINGTLYGSNAASTGPLPSTVLSVTGTVTNVGTIGKLGWQGGSSSQPYDVTFDNVYAADTAPFVAPTPPVINSVTSSTGYQNVGYSYQITANQPILSYALSGNTLPAGLTFDTMTGTISGIPTALGTTSDIRLTATNANGTSAAVNLVITIRIPINTFSGADPSLNTALSWSLGAVPNSSSSEGSYQNVILDSTVTDLTSTSTSLWAKSWNVNNGRSYTLTSGKTDGSSTFRMGITSPAATTFANAVSGVNNDLVYLDNNSSLTFSPINSISALTPSKVELFNSGNLNIGSGSTLNIDAATAGSYAITKTGAGTVGLSAANTYSEGTTLSAGTMNISGSAAPTRLAKVQASVADGVVTGYTVIDGGAGYTAVPTVLISYEGSGIPFPKATATAVISNGAVTAVTVVEGGGGYALAPKVQIFSNQSPLGTGEVTLSGGTLNATVDTDLSRMSFFPNPYNNFFRITGKDTAILGPVTLDVADGKTLSSYTLVSNSNPNNLITKNGQGTLWLRGGGTPADEPGIAFAGGFRVNAGTLSISVTSNSGTGTGTITMNGGNLRIGKGVGSNGDYSALDMNNRISVLLDTTITLDPNPGAATESNLASAAVLQSKASKTITVAKSSTANPGAQMIFRTAELEGTTTFNVADATQVVLGGATSTGIAGVTKTGLGTLMLSVLDSSTTPSTIMNNSYTGATAINAGTVSFYPGSTQASSISVANNAVAQFTLGNVTPTTSGSLTLSSGSKVRIIGTPVSSASPYTLFTAAGGITGTPVLETAISGYSLVKEGTSLKLKAGNANADPVIAAAQGFSVAENVSLATVVGTVVATDADANSTFSGWTIVSGNTGGVFAINAATGQITVAGALNYEGTPSYSLGVTVSDGTATSAVGTVVVTVTNIAEYSDVFGSSSPTADDNLDGISNLMAYALGAASPSSLVVPPALNTADPTKLTMTALIRIDDLKVSVVGIYGLAPGTWVTGSPIAGVPSSSQAGAVAGVTQRQDFSVLRGTDSKKFMYLKATQAP